MITEWIKKFLSWHAKIMTSLFGPSWKTSLYGIISVLPQFEKMVEDYFQTSGASAKWMNLISIIFAIITVMNA